MGCSWWRDFGAYTWCLAQTCETPCVGELDACKHKEHYIEDIKEVKMDNKELIEKPVTDIVYRPAEVIKSATEAAKKLKEIIASKPKKVMINGEQYLEYEDWQTVGRFYGVTAKATDANLIELDGVKGFKAQAVSIKDGVEISGATAYCMQDEENWKTKPLFQLASMAQTRACAKALRNVLAWVVVLAGFKATPAEEMDGVKPNGHKSYGNGVSKVYANISEKQAKRFYAICNGSKIGYAEIKDYLVGNFGVEKAGDLKPEFYDDACHWAKQGAVE